MVMSEENLPEFPIDKRRHRKTGLGKRLWRFVTRFERILWRPIGAFFLLWYFLVTRLTRVHRRGTFWEYLRQDRPCIVTLWHEDAFTTSFEYVRHTRAGYRSLAMVSAGRIGMGIGYLVTLFGMTPVHGSRRRKGVKAVRRLTEMVREDPRSVYIMADGSRGPSREARWGAIYLARDTGLPIIALRGWCDRAIILEKTWMKLALPLPWGRRVVLSSEPIFVPADADKAELERKRAELERRMNDLADASVAWFREGHPRVNEVRDSPDPLTADQ